MSQLSHLVVQPGVVKQPPCSPVFGSRAIKYALQWIVRLIYSIPATRSL